MAPSSFTENLIHSSQGRLPGSNMNENHHIMPGLFLAEDQSNQNNQVNPTGDRSQEAQRSVVGQQPYEQPQAMQSSDIDQSKADNFTRPKEHLDYDPDPATKSAFQNLSKPIPARKATSDSEGSVTNSLDSNRAIINEPLASQPIDTSKETMPATYRQDFQQGGLNQQGDQTLANTQGNQPRAIPMHDQGMKEIPKADVDPLSKQGVQGNTQTGMDLHPSSNVTGMNQQPPSHATDRNQPQSNVTGMNPQAGNGMNQQDLGQQGAPLQAGHDRGPLDTTGMMHQQLDASSPPMNGTPGQPHDFDYGRRRSSLHKRRGSTPDSECMAALPVMQSYVPYAQGVAIMTNHEARYDDDEQHAAASNRRYSLHGDEPAVPSDRRRSSLTETIGKIFHRRGSK